MITLVLPRYQGRIRNGIFVKSIFSQNNHVKNKALDPNTEHIWSYCQPDDLDGHKTNHTSMTYFDYLDFTTSHSFVRSGISL